MDTLFSPLDYGFLLKDGLAKIESAIAAINTAQASAARLLARSGISSQFEACSPLVADPPLPRL